MKKYFPSLLLVVALVAAMSLPLGRSLLGWSDQSLVNAWVKQQEATLRLMAIAAGRGMDDSRFLGSSLVLTVDLMELVDGLPDLSYVLVLGEPPGSADPPGIDNVLAARALDPAGEQMLGNLSALGFGAESLRADRLHEDSLRVAREMDREIQSEIGELRTELTRLAAQILEGQEDERREAATSLRQEIEARLARQRLRTIWSAPIDPTALADTYEAVKPVVRFRMADSRYVRGFLRIAVSTDAIQTEIREARGSVTRRIALFAASALLLGVVGAVLIARIGARRAAPMP